MFGNTQLYSSAIYILQHTPLAQMGYFQETVTGKIMHYHQYCGLAKQCVTCVTLWNDNVHPQHICYIWPTGMLHHQHVYTYTSTDGIQAACCMACNGYTDATIYLRPHTFTMGKFINGVGLRTMVMQMGGMD